MNQQRDSKARGSEYPFSRKSGKSHRQTRKMAKASRDSESEYPFFEKSGRKRDKFQRMSRGSKGQYQLSKYRNHQHQGR